MCSLSASLSRGVAGSAALQRRGCDCHAARLHLLQRVLLLLFVRCLAAPWHICCAPHLLAGSGARGADERHSSSTLFFWRQQKTIICIINGMSLILPASNKPGKANNVVCWLANLPASFCFEILCARVSFLRSAHLKLSVLLPGLVACDFSES